MECLPKVLLELVIERLSSFSDFVHFSVVCKSWYDAAKVHYNRRTTLISSCHHPPPMLMICSDEEKDTWNLYNVMDNKLLGLQLNVPSKRFCGSKGWLIAMDESFVVTLINPFSRVKGREKENSVIYLPPLIPPEGREAQWFAECDSYIFKATISADPILSVNDCIVMIIYDDLYKLAFIRLGDTTWSYTNVRTHFEEAVHVENNICVVDYWSKLHSIDITSQCHEDGVKLVAHGVKRPDDDYVKSYLVESSKERGLLMVRRYYYHDEDNNNKRVTTKFKVYELDFNEHRWVQKRTLGDVALFLGDNSSISVSASNFTGCLSNCIYFNHDADDVGFEYEFFHDFGVYDVKRKSFIPVENTDAATLVKKSKQPSIWVLPTFQL